MKVEIKKLDSAAKLPEYQHGSGEDAGLDLYTIEGGVLEAGAYDSFATGLAISLPAGYMAKVCPRSGLAFKNGITVLNAEGTIDPSYRGEIKVALINHSSEDYKLEVGDRIAQLIIEEYQQISWELTTNLDTTERGSGGFGHTGE